MISLYKDEKGMPLMNFKIVHAINEFQNSTCQKLEDGIKKKRLLKYGISIHWNFNH